MKKKILFVASTMVHIENFHLQYIAELKKENDVFTMATGKGFSGKTADFDVEFQKKIFSFKNLKTVKIIKRILKEQKFDVVILNTTLASFFVRLAIKHLKQKPKVINIVHGYLFGSNTGFVKKTTFLFAEKYVRKVTDHILVMNQEDKDIATKNKLSKNEVLFIRGMGIDSSRFKQIKTKPICTSKEFVISFIGELSSRKNQKNLIDFVAGLKKYDLNAKLNLIGYGDKEEFLKQYAKKLGVENQIGFVGYDSNIEKYLSETDYYVSASRIEGMPFNLLEAMFAGLVVFSSDIKGAVDIVEDFETGILFRDLDVENLITKFRIVRNDLTLQQKIRKNAKKTAEKYEINNVFGENISILKKLID